MAYTDLTPEEKQEVSEWIRDYRAAVADTVRGLNSQLALKMAYDTFISSVWAKINAGDLIPDESGLAGADHTMLKSDFTPKMTWTANLLAGVYSDNGGAVATVWPDRETVLAYGIQLAGPENIG